MLANVRNLTAARATRSSLWRGRRGRRHDRPRHADHRRPRTGRPRSPTPRRSTSSAVVVVGSLGGTVPAVVTAVAVVPGLRPAVHRAALLAGGHRPERAAQPRPGPDRRPRRRSARGARSGACGRGGPARDRGDRPVRRQPTPGDGGEHRGGRRRRRRTDRPRCRSRARLDRARWRRPGADPGRHGQRTATGRRDRHHARPNARRRAGTLGPRARAARPGDAGARPDDRWRPHPGQDRDRRERLRDALGHQAGRFRAARSRGDPPPVAGRRPARARASTRSAPRGGHQRRDRAPERRPQERPARLGLARPAHAAGQHPGHRRQPGRPRRRVVERRGPPGRRDDRRRGAASRPLRPLGARPQPDRIGRPAPRPRGLRPARARWSGPWLASGRCWATGRSTIDLAPGLPLVRVDAVLFDAIVANILDNIADHTPPGTPAGDPRRSRRTRSSPPHDRGRRSRASRRRISSTSSTSSGGRADRARVPVAGWASACRSCRGWPRRSTGA